MNISANVRPADCLAGMELNDDWVVDSIIHRPPTSTGGHFSVGYSATHTEDGKKGFLKAFDFSSALASPDPAQALNDLTDAYLYERNILEKCRDKRMRRIVVPLSGGAVNVRGSFGPLSRVVYLIFELADGDIRAQISKWQIIDVAWAFRSLHHSALGLQELHNAGIAHQDLKPSNVLYFPTEGTKISDLGRAKDIQIPSQQDGFQVPGDIGYAPPEQWYGWGVSADNEHRFLADIYHLGSLIFFSF